MFDLTDDVENSPNTTRKVKPTEVKPIDLEVKKILDKIPDKKKETPKNDDYNEYEYSDNKDADDKDW